MNTQEILISLENNLENLEVVENKMNNSANILLNLLKDSESNDKIAEINYFKSLLKKENKGNNIKKWTS